MRRYQPAVKRGREQFATVSCERFRVRHPFRPYVKSGESYDTPEPPSALASVRQRLFGGSATHAEHRSSLPATFQACPLRGAPPCNSD